MDGWLESHRALLDYRYWLHGRRLLQRPFDEARASGEPGFPFGPSWANEPWSRRWDGREQHVLLPQNYSAEDDLAHIRWLLPVFEGSRYVRVEGPAAEAHYRCDAIPETPG